MQRRYTRLPLSECTVAFEAFDSSSAQMQVKLRQSVVSLGGQCSPQIRRECTHIVVGGRNPRDDAVKFARQYSIHVVVPGWVESCVREERRVEEGRFLFFDLQRSPSGGNDDSSNYPARSSNIIASMNGRSRGRERGGAFRGWHVVSLGFLSSVTESLKEFVEKCGGAVSTMQTNPETVSATQDSALSVLPMLPKETTHVVVPTDFPYAEQVRQQNPSCLVVTPTYVKFIAKEAQSIPGALPLPINDYPEAFLPLDRSFERSDNVRIIFVGYDQLPLERAILVRVVEALRSIDVHVEIVDDVAACTHVLVPHCAPHITPQDNLNAELSVALDRRKSESLDFQVYPDDWLRKFARFGSESASSIPRVFQLAHPGSNIMAGVIVFLARAMPQSQKELILKRISSMGGDSAVKLSGEVTHFVDFHRDHSLEEVDRYERKLVQKFRIKTTTAKWIHECWRHKKLMSADDYPITLDDRRSLSAASDGGGATRRSVRKNHSSQPTKPQVVMSFGEALAQINQPHDSPHKNTHSKSSPLSDSFLNHISIMRGRDATQVQEAVCVNQPVDPAVRAFKRTKTTHAVQDDGDMHDVTAVQRYSDEGIANSENEQAIIAFHTVGPVESDTPRAVTSSSLNESWLDNLACDVVKSVPANDPSAAKITRQPMGPPLSFARPTAVPSADETEAPHLVDKKSADGALALKRKLSDSRIAKITALSQGPNVVRPNFLDQLNQDTVELMASQPDPAVDVSVGPVTRASAARSPAAVSKRRTRSPAAERPLGIEPTHSNKLVVVIADSSSTPSKLDTQLRKLGVLVHKEVSWYTNIIVCVKPSEMDLLRGRAHAAFFVEANWVTHCYRSAHPSESAHSVNILNDFRFKKDTGSTIWQQATKKHLVASTSNRLSHKIDLSVSRAWKPPFATAVLFFAQFDKQKKFVHLCSSAGATCYWQDPQTGDILSAYPPEFRSERIPDCAPSMTQGDPIRFDQWMSETAASVTLCVMESEAGVGDVPQELANLSPDRIGWRKLKRIIETGAPLPHPQRKDVIEILSEE